MQKFIYLDVCSLCRPFDDQSYMRIRLEAASVDYILTTVRNGRYKMLVSNAHHKEMESIDDVIELLNVLNCRAY